MHLSSVLKATLFASFAFDIRANVVDSLSSDIAAVSNAIHPSATQTAGTATASDATPIMMSTGGPMHETSGTPTAPTSTTTTPASSPSTSPSTTVSGSAGPSNGTVSGTAKTPSGTAPPNTTNTSKNPTTSPSPTKKSGASPLHGFDGSAGILFLIGILAVL